MVICYPHLYRRVFLGQKYVTLTLFGDTLAKTPPSPNNKVNPQVNFLGVNKGNEQFHSATFSFDFL